MRVAHASRWKRKALTAMAPANVPPMTKFVPALVHNKDVLQFAAGSLGIAWYCTLALGITMCVLAFLIPAHYALPDAVLPVLDVEVVPLDAACSAGFAPNAHVVAPTHMGRACVCPPESRLYVDSFLGECGAFHASHGCVDVSAPTTVPVWEPLASFRVCVRRGGTSAVTSDSGTLRVRSTYDPRDPAAACAEGFRKCGAGLCFDVGLPCPLTDVRVAENGSLVLLRDAASSESAAFVTGFGFVAAGGESEQGTWTPRRFLASMTPPARAQRGMPGDTLPFACGAGDAVCTTYTGHFDQSPVVADDPVWKFSATFEPSASHLECYSRLSNDPTSLPLWAPKVYLLVMVAWSLLVLCTALYGYYYTGDSGCCPPRSFHALRFRFAVNAVFAVLVVVALSQYFLILLRQTHAYMALPDCAAFGDGTRFSSALFACSVVVTCVSGVCAFASSMAHAWGAFVLDGVAQRFYKAECASRRAVRQKARNDSDMARVQAGSVRVAQLNAEAERCVEVSMAVMSSEDHSAFMRMFYKHWKEEVAVVPTAPRMDAGVGDGVDAKPCPV